MPHIAINELLASSFQRNRIESEQIQSKISDSRLSDIPTSCTASLKKKSQLSQWYAFSKSKFIIITPFLPFILRIEGIRVGLKYTLPWLVSTLIECFGIWLVDLSGRNPSLITPKMTRMKQNWHGILAPQDLISGSVPVVDHFLIKDNFLFGTRLPRTKLDWV